MKLIIAANHHRRSLYFEDTIKLFPSTQVVIQETGAKSVWGEFGVKGDNIHYINTPEQITYDESMTRFRDILMQFDWDMVAFLDNDLFLTATNYFYKTLIQMETDGFDFVSYFENGSEGNYEFNELIAPVYDQSYREVQEFPGFKPVPHWENAYMFLSRELYQKLSKDDLSNSRKMIKAIHSNGAKMGTKKRECRTTYSHFGDEWLHIGNLMKYYYIVESYDISNIYKYDPVGLIRIGYFLAHEKKYGKTFPEYLCQSYRSIANKMGKESVEKAWKDFIGGTCLE